MDYESLPQQLQLFFSALIKLTSRLRVAAYLIQLPYSD